MLDMQYSIINSTSSVNIKVVRYVAPSRYCMHCLSASYVDRLHLALVLLRLLLL